MKNCIDEYEKEIEKINAINRETRRNNNIAFVLSGISIGISMATMILKVLTTLGCW